MTTTMESREPSETGGMPADPGQDATDATEWPAASADRPPADDPTARRRNFLRLLFWNLLITVVICLPLYFFTSLPITLGFLGLMLLMSFTLAGYFALLRV